MFLETWLEIDFALTTHHLLYLILLRPLLLNHPLQQIPHKVILVVVDLTKLLFQEFLLVVVEVELQHLVVMLLRLQVEMEVRVHQMIF